MRTNCGQKDFLVRVILTLYVIQCYFLLISIAHCVLGTSTIMYRLINGFLCILEKSGSEELIIQECTIHRLTDIYHDMGF